jgi:hypothetical protein
LRSVSWGKGFTGDGVALEAERIGEELEGAASGDAEDADVRSEGLRPGGAGFICLSLSGPEIQVLKIDSSSSGKAVK